MEEASGCRCRRADVCSLLLLLLRHTHELKLHQLLVRVCGWEQVKPVSVDKVGVFFRYAAADRNNASNTVSREQPRHAVALSRYSFCSVGRIYG